MRVLLIYASRHGQTQKITEHLAGILRTHGAEASVQSIDTLPRDLRVEAFDTVVLAGPVYFGKHPAKLAQFVVAQRAALKRVRSIFVSVSGMAANHREEAAKTALQFTAETQWKPDRIEVVAGGEPYTRYGFFTKWLMIWKMRRLGRTVDPTRDYEYTDWSALDRFARELA